MENESEPEIQIEYYELHETDQLSDILSNNDSRSSVYRYYCKCLYFLFFFFLIISLLYFVSSQYVIMAECFSLFNTISL